MWTLYVIMSALCAGVVIKVVAPVMDRGRFRHGKGVTAADRRLALILVWAVPVASLSLYLALGRPDVPSSLALFRDVPEMLMRQDALLAEEPMQVLLKKNPDDLDALLKLGAINDRLKRYDEAVKFYKRAVVIDAAQNDILLRIYMEELGQAQVRANKGVVDEDARKTFEAVLKLGEKDPIARYYLALYKAQHGDVQVAVEEWSAMLSTGTPLAYWKWDVRAAISAARAGLFKNKNGVPAMDNPEGSSQKENPGVTP